MRTALRGYCGCQRAIPRQILVLVFLGLTVTVLASAGVVSDSWGVLAPGLPDRVSVLDEDNNVSFYVLKQTHEPLFRRQDGENYSSRILKRWTRSLDYRKYSFCPADNLSFAHGVPFGFEEFSAHVSSFTSGFAAAHILSRQKGCVSIEFGGPQKDFLYFWTAYKRAPTKDAGAGRELGLGSFYVSDIAKDKIELARKDPVSGGYNRIALYEYKGPDDPNLQNRGVKDFNLVNTEVIPVWVKDSFRVFDNPEMKSVILVINHPDPAVRAKVYGCVDIQALRSAFYPGKSDFYSIATVLPMGVPGAVPGLPAQDCNGGAVTDELRMANWMPGNDAAMEAFAREFGKKSGIVLRLERYSIADFAKAFAGADKPFELAVILVYTSYSPKDLFQMFFNRGELYDFEQIREKKKYQKVVASMKKTGLEGAYRELAEEVVRNSLALPLFQGRRAIYYPREIKNLNVGRGILEYPEVAEFVW